MSFEQLIRFVESKKQNGKWAAVNRLMLVSENYKQAKKAYFVTLRHCPEPSYGLLELMLSYANRKECLEILSIIENDDDELEFLNERVLEKYETICSSIIDSKPYGRDCPKYGFELLGELFLEAPEHTTVKYDALKTLIKAYEAMKDRREVTKNRLNAILKLEINYPRFIEIKNEAKAILDSQNQ